LGVKYAFFVVDRLEGASAVLVGDDGRTVEFPVLELPTPLREGTVLRVRYGPGNAPDWSSAVIDPKEQKRRLREASKTLGKLKRSDPGGDVKL